MELWTQSTVGASVQGRPLLAYEAPAPEPNSPSEPLHALFIGVVHGDEGISGQLLQYWLQQKTLAQEPLPPGLLLLPVMNPDGLDAETRTNHNGVDLNRNFPTENWSAVAESAHYHPGPRPGSEPETQAMLRLIQTRQPKVIITVHSPYRVVNYDGPAQTLAHAMAACNGYPVVESIGYPTPGSFGTWAGIERQIPIITLELPDNDPFDTVWRDNAPALEAAWQWALTYQPFNVTPASPV
jgi:murein peptide amidase A